MYHPTDRIAHTTAFVTPVVEHWLERDIGQWVHPMLDIKESVTNLYWTMTMTRCLFQGLLRLQERKPTGATCASLSDQQQGLLKR